MNRCIYLECKIDSTGSTGERNYRCLYHNKEVDPIANCKFCEDHWNGFENKIETPTVLKCRSDYEEGYARGFAAGYERALKTTPTFPMVSTSPAIVNIPQACKNCPNHPSNGGDGICHCTLGCEPIYTNPSFTSINTGTHYGFDTFIAEDIRGYEGDKE